ncbi:hypothetical protein C8F01DRAFT_1110734 [Mycena amicta]|nr:hypothetical protein C8F01DRAFT_1110734 [Mycena amicta]
MIFAIPLEVLQEILLLCHPRDVAAFLRTCRAATIAGDEYFWHQLFLGTFDNPPDVSDGSSYDWRGQLTARIRAERDARNATLDTETHAADRQTALELLVAVATQSLSASDRTEPSPSRNVQWLEGVLRKSRILDATFLPEESAYADRLRAYMALSSHANSEPELRLVRTRSRCFVYDLRNYTEANSWGPYLQKRINWTHLNSIVNIIVTNLREQQPALHLPMPPHGLDATRAYSAPGERSAEDWAGVEGTWHRYVAFMDYRDLAGFKFGGIHTNPRDPAFFDNLNFREATRLIELTMHLIPREQMQVRFPVNDPPSPTHPDYPTLFFGGKTRAISMSHHQQPTVQGFVYMDMEGVARWKFTSIQAGDPQWCSEGVQMGNPGSAMGICGIWSAFSHQEDDPVGPFWAWKVGN